MKMYIDEYLEILFEIWLPTLFFAVLSADMNRYKNCTFIIIALKYQPVSAHFYVQRGVTGFSSVQVRWEPESLLMACW